MTRRKILLSFVAIILAVNIIYLLWTAQVEAWNILTLILAAALGGLAVQGEKKE